MTYALLSQFAKRFSDSQDVAIITLHNRKRSFDGVEPRSVRTNGKQLGLNRNGKSPNPRLEVIYHVA
jgi:hypothetical protein